MVRPPRFSWSSRVPKRWPGGCVMLWWKRWWLNGNWKNGWLPPEEIDVCQRENTCACKYINCLYIDVWIFKLYTIHTYMWKLCMYKEVLKYIYTYIHICMSALRHYGQKGCLPVNSRGEIFTCGKRSSWPWRLCWSWDVVWTWPSGARSWW